MSISIKALLKEHVVGASAPCRIDSGGTWDIKAMALPLARIRPTTVNIALSLRTHVTLLPHRGNRVKISSAGFRHKADFSKDHFDYNSAFGLFLAAVSFFGYHGMEIHIKSQSPVKSALGGSSTALVALIKALSKVNALLGGKGLSKAEILHLGYHLEDGINGGNCGLQDQAAAVYGAVNQWNWHYGNRSNPYERVILLDRHGQKELSKHILVAYSGKTHISSRTNRDWIGKFLSGQTRDGWIEANEIVTRLALAVKKQNWCQAAKFLRQEMALRRRITPEALIPITEKLVRQAEGSGCGARFAGAGAGGALWAIGEEKDVTGLRKKWKSILAPIKGAGILDCHVESKGVE